MTSRAQSVHLCTSGSDETTAMQQLYRYCFIGDTKYVLLITNPIRKRWREGGGREREQDRVRETETGNEGEREEEEEEEEERERERERE